MAKKQHIQTEFLNKASIIWIGLLALSICLNIGGVLLYKYLNMERAVTTSGANFISLGVKLKNASDYLTDMAREFSITGDLQYLHNYWDEVYINKTREMVIDQLKELNAPANELGYLNEAKHNSDALVGTEVRSMKLLSIAMGVPEDTMYPDVKNYILSESDNHLSNNDKINKAQEGLFDEKYINAKAKIIGLITKFQQVMEIRIHNETMAAQAKTNQYFFITAALSFIIFLILLSMIWSRVWSWNQQ